MIDRSDEKLHRRILLVILVVAGLIRLAYALEASAWHAPDEYAHFWVAEQIAREGTMPVSTPDFPAFEAYQPPLYYWLVSWPLQLFDEAVIFELVPQPLPPPLAVLRLFSVVFSVLTIWVAYRFLRLLPDLEPSDALWSAGFMALLPSFVGTGSTVTNDSLVVLPAAVCLWLLWQPKPTDRTLIGAGLCAGLAVLTKLTGLALVPVAVLRLWQLSDRDHRTTLRRLLPFAVGWVGPVSILVARNLILYDNWLALTPGVVKGFGLTLPNTVRAIRNLTWSFWLALGYGYKVQLPPFVYVLTALPMMLAALWGWLRQAGSLRLLWIPVWFTIAVAVVGSLTHTVSYLPGDQTSWGKNLFPVLPMIAVAMVVGWRSVWRRYPVAVPTTFLGTLLAGSLWGLWQLSRLAQVAVVEVAL